MIRTFFCKMCGQNSVCYSLVETHADQIPQESWVCQTCGTTVKTSGNLLQGLAGPIRPVPQATPQITTQTYQEGSHANDRSAGDPDVSDCGGS